MSDIVFLRAWYPVKPHRYYNPVTNLVSITNDGQWQGMRLTAKSAALEASRRQRNETRPIARLNA